jgi:5-formaminoimidazole-4-carboxamide-1-beta-D-ribofuranosyl 5'-monophosphate synthetase
LSELKGRKEAFKDQKLIKREALTDGTIETLLDGMKISIEFHSLTICFRFEKSTVFTC